MIITNIWENKHVPNHQPVILCHLRWTVPRSQPGHIEVPAIGASVRAHATRLTMTRWPGDPGGKEDLNSNTEVFYRDFLGFYLGFMGFYRDFIGFLS